jgi:hypothetical protein
MAQFNQCNFHHRKVLFSTVDCPVCEARIKIEELHRKIETLKNQIDSLNILETENTRKLI